jgi:amidase
MGDELWRHSALELAAAIAGKEVSSTEVVEAHLRRIDEVNGALNAVVRVLADEARVAAAEADRAVSEGEPLGPFHGVPFTIKENIDLAGSPTTQGLPALAEVVAPLDAPVVERLKAAGAVPLARTNLPDMGLRVHTHSGLHGLTRNPWDAGRTAGGSSGGEASALASGMSPLGLGNDIGGSLRNPAYCCGVASLKPSSHRIPFASSTAPAEPFLAAQLMAVEGPMARRVADVRAAFAVLAGPHVRDPFCVPAPLEGPPLARRVALVPEPPGAPTDPAVADGVRAAGRALAEAGYEVDEVVPPLVEEAIEVWGRWLLAELAVLRPLLAEIMSTDAMNFLDAAEAALGPVSLEEGFELMMRRFGIARAWSEFFVDHPVLVGPTWTQPPFPHGWDIEAPERAGSTLEMMRFVTPMNLLGLPVACVPTGTANGLPLGVQVVGPWYREDVCFDAAQAVEDRLGTITPIDPVV